MFQVVYFFVSIWVLRLITYNHQFLLELINIWVNAMSIFDNWHTCFVCVKSFQYFDYVPGVLSLLWLLTDLLSLFTGLLQCSSSSSTPGQPGTTPHVNIPTGHHHPYHLILHHLTHGQWWGQRRRGSGVADRGRHQQSSGICKS